MKRIYLLIIVLFISRSIYSQNLSAYHDYRDKFYIFDNGKAIFAEPLPVISYKIGNKSLAYVTNSGVFKVYNDGNFTKLSESVNEYLVTDNYIVYDLYGILKVFDNGKIVSLSNNYSRYSAGDSVIAYYDKSKKIFYAYYNGEITELEDAIAKDPISNFNAADNIIAFKSNNNYLKAFYKGESFDLVLAETPLYYKVGRNIVAFINKSYGSFNVFYKGEVIKLSSYIPESYFTADNIVCWVDYSGEFKIFDSGEINIISSYAPDEYFVDDKIIVYHENDFLKAYYKNTIYTIENYIPVKVKTDYGRILYFDNQNRLKLFENGEVKILSNENINFIDINNNVINFNEGVNSSKVYYNGVLY